MSWPDYNARSYETQPASKRIWEGERGYGHPGLTVTGSYSYTGVPGKQKQVALDPFFSESRCKTLKAWLIRREKLEAKSDPDFKIGLKSVRYGKTL